MPAANLLPADESLRELDLLFAGIGNKQRLARVAGTLGKRHERIIIDCPPVLNQISAQVIRAVSLVVVPLPPTPRSARPFEPRERGDCATRATG